MTGGNIRANYARKEITMSYKYANVHEWFEQFAREQKENELFAIVIELASKLSADDLQDLFQSEMTEDGYFDSEAQ